jgi:transcriptional regulator with XRE-family HTH domain
LKSYRFSHRYYKEPEKGDKEMYINTHKLGWRVRTLRLRHGLSLVEVADRAGVDMSYISRLERDALQNAKPKPDTIDKVLAGMNAAPEERDAVYHIEQAPLPRRIIDEQVRRVAGLAENSPDPVELADDRWFIHYYNRAARSALGLTAEEYKRAVGTHILHAIIDPTCPLYARVPNEERPQIFALRARMFKLTFASQEFDEWYGRVVERICEVPWAKAIWEDDDYETESLVLERQDFTVLNPVAGYMRMRFQLNHLMGHPRFILSEWSVLGTVTAIQLAVLRTRPEYSYSYETAISQGNWVWQDYGAIALY